MQVDLISDAAELAQLEHLIHSINAEAAIIHTQKSQVDLRRILDRKAYRDPSAADGEAAPEQTCGHAGAASCSLCSPAHAEGGSKAGGDAPSASSALDTALVNGRALNEHGHVHDSGIRTVAVRESRRLDLERCGHDATSSISAVFSADPNEHHEPVETLSVLWPG